MTKPISLYGCSPCRRRKRASSTSIFPAKLYNYPRLDHTIRLGGTHAEQKRRTHAAIPRTAALQFNLSTKNIEMNSWIDPVSTFLLTEADMIDIFNAIRCDDEARNSDYEPRWKITRSDNKYLLRSKNEMCKWNGRLRRATVFWKLT